eukprot:EG_transcript_35
MVVGPPDGQKSSLLSYILELCGVPGPRHFLTIKDGMAGLWVWPQLVLFRDRPFLVLDCECCDPTLAEPLKPHLETLFGLSAVMSTVVIYTTPAHPLTAERMERLTQVTAVLDKHVQDLAAVLGSPEETPRPFLTYCLREWPGDIPIDPLHPPVLAESANGRAATPRVGTIFASLPVCRPEGGAVGAKRVARKGAAPSPSTPQRGGYGGRSAALPPSPNRSPASSVTRGQLNRQPSPTRPKPKAKAGKPKRPKPYCLADCDPAFAAGLRTFLRQVYDHAPPQKSLGPAYVSRLATLLTAVQMIADGKGLEADVARLIQQYTQYLRQSFVDIQKQLPMPTPVLREKVHTLTSESGVRLWQDILALQRTTTPSLICSAADSGEYLHTLLEADIVNLVAENEMLYDSEVTRLVDRLVQERMSDLNAITSREVALKVWPSQIPPSLETVKADIETRVAKQMTEALAGFETKVASALQACLWRVASPFFEVPTGRPLPPAAIPDLSKGLGPAEVAFRTHLDTLLFPSVGAAFELLQAAEDRAEGPGGPLPRTPDIITEYDERTAGVPRFLVPNIGQIIPAVKQKLGALCLAYGRKEVARVYSNVLRELLVPMGLPEVPYNEDWVDLRALAPGRPAPTVPAELTQQLEQLVLQGPLVVNQELLSAKWREHCANVLQLTVPALSQLFTESAPCGPLQYALQQELRALIAGSTDAVVAALPELGQQLLVDIEGGPTLAPAAVAQRVAQRVPGRILHAGPAPEGEGCRLLFESEAVAVRVLRCPFPADWGFRPQPLQVPRVLMTNLPAQTEERAVRDLISIYCGIELRCVNIKAASAELVLMRSADVDTLLEIGNVRLLGQLCELKDFDTFDLSVPGEDQPTARFPTKRTLQAALGVDVAFVEGVDAATVRVGLWTPANKTPLFAAAVREGFLVPKLQSRPGNRTFLGHFSAAEPVTVNCPPEEYKALAWDPVEYKMQVGDLVDRISRQVPADKLGAALHKDPHLRNYRRIAMLATMAACENRCYFAGADRVDIGPASALVTTNYGETLPPLRQPRHPATKVVIEDTDMMELAGFLSRSGQKVLMLNMANPVEPGGGWMSGTAAQEEDLFRRSDYHLGITQFGAAGKTAQYPIPVFGAIVTENVTVFRGDEQEGYRFLPDPFVISIIAVAAFNCHNYVPPGQGPATGGARAPATAKLPDGRLVLTDEVCVYTRRKLETLFRAAVDKGFDTLVLSALGCGAFGNPPLSMAHVFHEVLSEYAGQVKQVHFAIKNEAICDAFLGIVRPEYSAALGAAYGHLDYSRPLPVCPLGGKCLDLGHQQAAHHVPLCAHPRACPVAQQGYNLHRILTAHLQDCPQQALCTLIDDAEHCRLYDHPAQHCVMQGECQNMELAHLHAYRHVPTCELGGPDRCPQYEDKSHRMQRRHPLQPCPMQGQCYNHLSDAHHLAVFSHPFANPCPRTPHCLDTSAAHRKHFAHVCPVGSTCTEMQDPNHGRHHIHFPPHACPDSGCTSLAEDHLNTFSHPGVLDIRPLCPNGEKCVDQHEAYHVKQFTHRDVPQELCKVSPVFADRTKGQEVDYAANVKALQAAILGWMARSGIRPPPPDSPKFQRIVQFFRNSRPVHRCSFEKVQNMVRSGAVLSLHCVENLVTNISRMVDLVLTHPLVVPVCQAYLEHRTSLRDLVKNKLLLTLYKSNTPGMGGDALKAKYHEETLRSEFGPLIVAMADSMPLLDGVIQGMVQSALDVRKTGIGFERDQVLGTDQGIFAVQGINIAGSYGRIRLIFHPDVMHHPNFYLTPFAAVFFADDADSPAQYALNRPWVDGGVSKPWAAGGRQRFLEHQLHPSTPEVFETLALEFVARVVVQKGLRDAGAVDWEQVMEYWHRYTHNPSPTIPDEQRELESCHWAPESHCPYSMPLSYVEHVVMSEETYRDTFTPQMQSSLRRAFASVYIERDEQAAHERAVALATAPHRQRRGYCFSLAADVNETYLPLTAPPSAPLHLYFKARGAFAVVFSSELSDQSPQRRAFTMTVAKGEVVVFEGSTLTPLARRRVLAQVTGFNDRLDPTDFIFYYCCIDPQRNQVLLDHWGPSELHSSTKGLVLNSSAPVPRDLRYVSFKAMDSLTAFHDVFATPNRLRPVADPQVPCRPACASAHSCPLAYYTPSEDPAHIAHTAQYLHPCLWGEQCINTDPGHQSRFSHQRAPHGACPHGASCARREDFRHRQQYSHAGLWAFMLLCKHATRAQCEELQRDAAHCTKYYHQEDAPERRVSFSTVYQVVDVDDENVEQSIYNMAVAGKTAFGDDVQRDAFGVALGADYDLAVPGSRKGWNVLVGNFGQRHELTEADLEKCAFVSLRSLGFSIEYTESEKAFTRALQRGPKPSWPKPTHHLAGIPRNQELIKQWHVLWIISGPKMRDADASPQAFVDAVVKCHLRGNGLLLWAENEPFFHHANLVLPHLQQTRPAPDIRLTGNTCGKGCIMMPGSATTRSQYGSHFITTGVERLYEGNTICYPTGTAGFTVLGTSSAGHPVLLYGDAQHGPGVQYCGRVVIDNGWTKLVPALWATAGTPRYISNSTSWLAFLERLSRKYRMPVSDAAAAPATPLPALPGVIAPAAVSAAVAPPGTPQASSSWLSTEREASVGRPAPGTPATPERAEDAGEEEEEEDEEEEWETEDEEDL